MYRYFVVIIIFLLLGYNLKGQYAQFSQFYAAPLVLAPSFAGSAQSGRITINHRNQWTGASSGVYITSAVGVDYHAQRIHSGFGLLIVRDQAGTGNLGRIDFGLLYSWYGQISRTGVYFRPGLQLKLSQRGVDFEKLVFPDQLNLDGPPTEVIQPPPNWRRKYFLDATASLMVYSEKFWVGITADHLFRPNDAFYDDQYRVPIKYQFFGGYKFGTYTRRRRSSDYYLLTFNFRYQAGSMQLDAGGYWEHEPILLGAWIRGIPFISADGNINMAALVFMAGYHISSFTFGYSYDLPISALLMTVGGTHEVSLTYRFATQTRYRQRRGAIPCPKM